MVFALKCGFTNQPYKTVPSLDRQCGPACQADTACTHFMFNPNLLQCYFLSGPVEKDTMIVSSIPSTSDHVDPNCGFVLAKNPACPITGDTIICKNLAVENDAPPPAVTLVPTTPTQPTGQQNTPNNQNQATSQSLPTFVPGNDSEPSPTPIPTSSSEAPIYSGSFFDAKFIVISVSISIILLFLVFLKFIVIRKRNPIKDAPVPMDYPPKPADPKSDWSSVKRETISEPKISLIRKSLGKFSLFSRDSELFKKEQDDLESFDDSFVHFNKSESPSEVTVEEKTFYYKTKEEPHLSNLLLNPMALFSIQEPKVTGASNV
ncbi:hypothetical protein HK103_006246 [Boothiomyces macroporosus]|uniref:Apple domain-containing protein n=1 Tax=Boothiomyces macroporosus TaxID=261099 RepID=A0AAD5UH66_9FUNG|nr:hypothetical protein HK103_006246 [Boothiomyces macroporosus]